jgi:two-component system, chemotaxis family, protein-glutamate methylesterase/glutaminase
MVVRRRAAGPPAAAAGRAEASLLALPRMAVDVLAVGASTGGPTAIGEMLGALPTSFAAPILVVQHIAPGFIRGMAEWLREFTGLPIHLAGDDDLALPGNVYLAPDGCQMGVTKRLRIRLSDARPEHGLKPSVSFLFRSTLEAFGGRSAAVLMSGMGKDGANELLELRRIGSATFAQDAESALVFGMPGEAVRLGAAQLVLRPSEIGAALVRMVGGDSPGSGSLE